MAVLDRDLQNQIDTLSEQAYEKFQENEVDESFKLLKAAWDLYPEPKNQWNEAYNNARYLFDDYMRMDDLNNAKIWLDHMVDHNNSLHLFDADLCFQQGKYLFEKGNYQEALNKWREVVKDSGMRYFEDQKKGYLSFYTNPGALINA